MKLYGVCMKWATSGSAKEEHEVEKVKKDQSSAPAGQMRGTARFQSIGSTGPLFRTCMAVSIFTAKIR